MIIMLNFSYFYGFSMAIGLSFWHFFLLLVKKQKMTAVNARSFEPLLYNKAIQGGRQRMESTFMRQLLMFSSDTTFPFRCFLTTTVSKDWLTVKLRLIFKIRLPLLLNHCNLTINPSAYNGPTPQTAQVQKVEYLKELIVLIWNAKFYIQTLSLNFMSLIG